MIIIRGNIQEIYCNFCNKKLNDADSIIHYVHNKKLMHFCNNECKNKKFKTMAAPTLMKIFFDTEFIEGPQTKTFLGIPMGKTKPTIDLISIGMVREDGTSFYAISKDFNLKEAWGRPWIKDDVLLPIFHELIQKAIEDYHRESIMNDEAVYPSNVFSYQNLKLLINKYGHSNKDIARHTLRFCTHDVKGNKKQPEFYGYYADYDWVVFCWLFGLMIDLPKEFPYYCNDLMQSKTRLERKLGKPIALPVPTGEHNTLVDANWNLQLYKHLTSL